MPDIDIDFCMDRRDEVIQYVTEKYGNENVAQIITFGTMLAKGVLRDVGRTLDMPYSDVDRIAKLVPNRLNITLDEAIAEEPRLREMQTQDPRVERLIETARRLEGLSRHASVHAAGVVISPEPLHNIVPLSKGAKGEVVTQYAMDDIEAMGLLKMDFLGLRTLTVIHNALRFIKDNQGITLDIENIPLDDPETYRLLSEARTNGVFQLEGRGLRDLLRKLQPTCSRIWSPWWRCTVRVHWAAAWSTILSSAGMDGAPSPTSCRSWNRFCAPPMGSSSSRNR